MLLRAQQPISVSVKRRALESARYDRTGKIAAQPERDRVVVVSAASVSRASIGEHFRACTLISVRFNVFIPLQNSEVEDAFEDHQRADLVLGSQPVEFFTGDSLKALVAQLIDGKKHFGSHAVAPEFLRFLASEVESGFRKGAPAQPDVRQLV